MRHDVCRGRDGRWSLTRRKRTRVAFYLLVGSIFWVICGISVVFDVYPVLRRLGPHTSGFYRWRCVP